MFIRGLGTAAPPKRYAQADCWDALCAADAFARLTARSRAILRKVLGGDNGIDTRHLALDRLSEAFELNPDALHARFARHAPDLAAQAARRALADAEVQPEKIDVLLISTCTGYLCPGLTSYVAEQLGLRRDVCALDLVGQGCGAALPNLRTAEAYLASGRANRVLSVCVEVCSAAFYLDDDPGVLVSACLFGDGAGAAVLAREAGPARRRVAWKGSYSRHDPERRELLRFDQQGGMLRNILSAQVPQLAGEAAAELLRNALSAAGVDRREISGWILHAGGRDVLVALRECLGLTDPDLRHSAAALREFGNLSSPTVYFVLEAAVRDEVPDGSWWMSSFGAGFSCHGALLQVTTSR